MFAKLLLAVLVGGFLGSASAIELATGVEGTLSASNGQVVLTVQNAGRLDVEVDNLAVLMPVKQGAKQSEVILSTELKQRIAPGRSASFPLLAVDSLVSRMRSDGVDLPDGPFSLISIETSPNGCSKCEERSKAQWIRPFGLQSAVSVGDVKASALFGGYVTFVRYH